MTVPTPHLCPLHPMHSTPRSRSGCSPVAALQIPGELCRGHKNHTRFLPQRISERERGLLSAESALGHSQLVSSRHPCTGSGAEAQVLCPARRCELASGWSSRSEPHSSRCDNHRDHSHSLVQGLLPLQVLDAQGAQDSVHQGLVLEDDPAKAVQKRHGDGRASRRPHAASSRSTGSDPAPVTSPPPRPRFRTGSDSTTPTSGSRWPV